ncbi:MAG: hypothetical protein K8R28_10165 [Desulfobacterales bacterium]|nr:hypothetical protein [Desulfobacterales bacterium]
MSGVILSYRQIDQVKLQCKIDLKPKSSDFLLDLHQSLAHQGLAKSLDIAIGMPTLFANLAASRPWHISSQKIAQLRLKKHHYPFT